MRNVLKILLLFGIIILVINSCKKDDTTDSCGCNSIILGTIPELEPVVGTISFKIALDPNDTYYNNKYWIGYYYDYCVNCYHSYIVCNDALIPSELKHELSNGAVVNIIFAGHIKNPCEKKFDIPERSFLRITLTKIEKQ